MRRPQAGHATARPTIMRAPEGNRFLRNKNRVKKCVDIQISHHTGARLMVFPLHIIEFTKKTKHAIAVQIMYAHVPTFRASRCQGRGMSERINPIPENTVNVVLEAVISGRYVSRGKDAKTFN